MQQQFFSNENQKGKIRIAPSLVHKYNTIQYLNTKIYLSHATFWLIFFFILVFLVFVRFCFFQEQEQGEIIK